MVYELSIFGADLHQYVLCNFIRFAGSVHFFFVMHLKFWSCTLILNPQKTWQIFSKAEQYCIANVHLIEFRHRNDADI